MFKKLLAGAVLFTGACWAGALVFSAMAGESPQATIKKLESRLQRGSLVEEREVLDLNGVESIIISTTSRMLKFVR